MIERAGPELLKAVAKLSTGNVLPRAAGFQAPSNAQ
jgi:hypothetical protein